MAGNNNTKNNSNNLEIEIHKTQLATPITIEAQATHAAEVEVPRSLCQTRLAVGRALRK
jgi:hypothetical protein